MAAPIGIGMTDEAYSGSAEFLATAMREVCGFREPARTRVLDFGCGRGDLIAHLTRMGFDVRGCDVKAYWKDWPGARLEVLDAIARNPYRLPYDNDTFDAIVSTSVLEHAQNKEDIFKEMHRVLRCGGYAMHLVPGKWYLPSEPHIYVPLVNYFWPRIPRWWLSLWALAGIRNEYQQGKSWRDVARENHDYCRDGLSYWSNRRYRQVSREIFGNYSAPMEFYVAHSPGGTAAMLRNLPFRRFTGWLAGEFRMNFIVQRKQTGETAAVAAR